MYKPSQEALNLHAADVAEAAERGKLLDTARAADAALREAEATRAPVAEVHRLAKELDAALTAAMRAAYAAERAEIGPRGYGTASTAARPRRSPPSTRSRRRLSGC